MKIQSMSTQEIAQYLRNDRHCAFILWQIKDVQSYGLQESKPAVKVSEEEAKEIIHDLNRRADCTYGITWGHLEDAISSLSNT